MSKYRTRALIVADEWGDYDSLLCGSIDVIEENKKPIDTGLFDADGERLYRVEKRNPIGFVVR
jgi:hypothetical protein